MGAKFSNADRHRLIRHIEKEAGVSLNKVGRKDKIRIDDAGNIYVVIGGVETWHTVEGKDLEMIEGLLAGEGLEALLVWGHWVGKYVDVYRASVRPFLGKKAIFKNMMLVPDGRTARIKDFPEFRLIKWFDFGHTDDDSASQGRVDKVTLAIEKMTPEQKKQLLANLQEGGN